jgi:hypothetical protein
MMLAYYMGWIDDETVAVFALVMAGMATLAALALGVISLIKYLNAKIKT